MISCHGAFILEFDGPKFGQLLLPPCFRLFIVLIAIFLVVPILVVAIPVTCALPRRPVPPCPWPVRVVGRQGLVIHDRGCAVIMRRLRYDARCLVRLRMGLLFVVLVEDRSARRRSSWPATAIPMGWAEDRRTLAGRHAHCSLVADLQ